jgi:predicted SAM-dependent methyltransferase
VLKRFNSVKKLLSDQQGPLKLNVGCGTDYKDGWINIDNNSDDNIVKLDLNWDLRKPLPFPDNSVDFIFNEHFMEHLTVEEGQAALKDFKRVLKKGGVLRVAMPDLEMVVDDYLNVPIKKNKVLKAFGLEFIETRAELINMSFRWWGHKWLYDWEELDRRLKQAGFSKIKQGERLKSQHKELCALEIRDESRLIGEATK